MPGAAKCPGLGFISATINNQCLGRCLTPTSYHTVLCEHSVGHTRGSVGDHCYCCLWYCWYSQQEACLPRWGLWAQSLTASEVCVFQNQTMWKSLLMTSHPVSKSPIQLPNSFSGHHFHSPRRPRPFTSLQRLGGSSATCWNLTAWIASRQGPFLCLSCVPQTKGKCPNCPLGTATGQCPVSGCTLEVP